MTAAIRRLVLLIIIQSLAVFILFLLFPSLMIRSRPGTAFTSGDRLLPLDTTHSYQQSVDSLPAPLESISLQLKNPALQNHDPIYLDVLNSDNQILRSLAITGDNVGDPSWIDFKFTPVDSTQTAFRLSTLNQADNALYAYSDGSQLLYKTSYHFHSFGQSFLHTLEVQKNRLLSLPDHFLPVYSLLLITLTALLVL